MLCKVNPALVRIPRQGEKPSHLNCVFCLPPWQPTLGWAAGGNKHRLPPTSTYQSPKFSSLSAALGPSPDAKPERYSKPI